MKIITLFFFFLCLLPCLTGCNGNTQIDKSLITKEPCTVPCWYDLEINKSSKEDVINKLNKLEFVNQASIKEYDETYVYNTQAYAINYDCTYQRRSGWCGSFIIIDEKLAKFSYGIEYKLTIKELVSLYGNPDFVIYLTPTTEAGGCNVNIIWPKLLLEVGYSDIRNTSPCDQIKKDGKMDPNLILTYVNISDYEQDKTLLPMTVTMDWNGFVEEK